VEEPDRSADNAAPKGDAAPAPQVAEHPVASDEATMVPAEPSRPEIERREIAADAASPESQPSESVARIEAAEEVAYEGSETEDDDEGFVGAAEPLEFIDESVSSEDLKFDWYILKVAVNREDSIKEALLRRVKMNGLEKYFQDVVVPTEDVKEFTKTGKPRVVKKKLYPGYILINMAINDESWFVVRETPGIGDFTGAGGKPSPMAQKDVDRILKLSRPVEEGEASIVKTAIPFKKGDRVRVKEGYFQNFEGDVDVIDEASGRVTVLVNIFGRPTPVELDHWQMENV
jgi:transcriptional antiterminator NusG